MPWQHATVGGECATADEVMKISRIRIWDYVLSVCDWVCVHNFRPEVFLFGSMSALNISCPKISERYLSGSPMCLASHGMIEVMLMQTLTKTFLAWKQNIRGLKLRGSEIGYIRFWNLQLFPYAYSTLMRCLETPQCLYDNQGKLIVVVKSTPKTRQIWLSLPLICLVTQIGWQNRDPGTRAGWNNFAVSYCLCSYPTGPFRPNGPDLWCAVQFGYRNWADEGEW